MSASRAVIGVANVVFFVLLVIVDYTSWIDQSARDWVRLAAMSGMAMSILALIVVSEIGPTTRRIVWAAALLLAVGAAMFWSIYLIDLFQRDLDAEELRSWGLICLATAIIPCCIALAVDRLADGRR